MKRWRFFTAALLLTALASCASPDPAFYTLRAVAGTPTTVPAEAIQILRPGLAGYLDRPEIVRDRSANQLTLRSGERWGEPLGDMIGRVVALDLSQRLAGSSVFTEAGSLTVDAAVELAIDIQRFDLDTSGSIVLQAQFAVSKGRNHDAANARSVTIMVPTASTATADVVSAMSAALGQLSNQIGVVIANLPRKKP